MRDTHAIPHLLSLTRYPSHTPYPSPTIPYTLPFQQRTAEIIGHKSDQTNSSHKGADSCTSSLSFRFSLSESLIKILLPAERLVMA